LGHHQRVPGRPRSKTSWRACRRADHSGTVRKHRPACGLRLHHRAPDPDAVLGVFPPTSDCRRAAVFEGAAKGIAGRAGDNMWCWALTTRAKPATATSKPRLHPRRYGPARAPFIEKPNQHRAEIWEPPGNTTGTRGCFLTPAPWPRQWGNICRRPRPAGGHRRRIGTAQFEEVFHSLYPEVLKTFP